MDDNNKSEVFTSGGAHIGRDVNAGRDVAGRDIISSNVTVHIYSAPLTSSEANKALTTEYDSLIPLLQLPPRPKHFVGRDEELMRILSILKPGIVITLCGPAGIGKSALAAEIIWHLTDGIKPPKDFPDGIIFYNFYRHPEVDLALEHIVRVFGEAPFPSLTAAVQRALAGRKMLILLDGTEEVDDLSKILDVLGGCGVLITSRSRRDSVDPDQRYDLKVLAINEAVTLLKAWGGNRTTDEFTIQKICELVGRLPIAVRLVGHYLTETDEMVDEYLSWLKEAPLDALEHGQHQQFSVSRLLARSVEQISEIGRTILVSKQ